MTQISVTSDFEAGYGLALYTDASTNTTYMYFTLADDVGLLDRTQPHFGAASTFGYINLTAWEHASAQCGCPASLPDGAGVVYSDLSSVTDPTTSADFRGRAVGSNKQIALADWNQVVSFP